MRTRDVIAKKAKVHHAQFQELRECLAELEKHMTDCGYFVNQYALAARARRILKETK